MKKLLTAALTILSLLMIVAFSPENELPKNWFKAGSKPDNYNMGIDKTIFKTGSSSATIQSTKKDKNGFGTLMQTCDAKDFLGKNIKLSGYIKSENIETWAGMWLRIDGHDGGRPLGFDNMRNRPIKGTQDWTYCEIILDVPYKAATLNFGALLDGSGKIWFDDLKFEVVDKDEKTTGVPKIARPNNLGFEE